MNPPERSWLSGFMTIHESITSIAAKERLFVNKYHDDRLSLMFASNSRAGIKKYVAIAYEIGITSISKQ